MSGSSVTGDGSSIVGVLDPHTSKGVPPEGALRSAQQLQPPGLLLMVFVILDPPEIQHATHEPRRVVVGGFSSHEGGQARAARIKHARSAAGRCWARGSFSRTRKLSRIEPSRTSPAVLPLTWVTCGTDNTQARKC